MATKKKVVTSREDGVTKDMPRPEATEREFTFPRLGVSVKASSFQEALTKAKKIKSNN